MSRTYVIADVHGRHDLLAKALEAIRQRQGTETANLVTLGDYIDRGPDSRGVVEMLMKVTGDPSFSMVNLMGNHEAMMLECIAGKAEMGWWIRNGGDMTLASYRGSVPRTHIAWARGLRICYSDAYRVFVHAGVDPALAPDRQLAEYALWVRYGEATNISYPGKYIVHGHTPVLDGPQVFAGRANLDTGAYLTGRLVVGVFDDDVPGAPVDFIELRA